MPLAPHPSRTIAVGWAILSLCVAVMLFGTFACAAKYSHEYRVRWSEVMNAPISAGPQSAIERGRGVAVIFLSITAAILWHAYSRHRADPKARKGVLLLSYPILSVVGALTGAWPAFVAPIIAFLGVTSLGRTYADVEFLNFGLFIWTGLGLWMWTLALVLILDLCRRPLPDHQCQSCGYDRSGLDAPSRCPECGAPYTSPAGATP